MLKGLLPNNLLDFLTVALDRAGMGRGCDISAAANGWRVGGGGGSTGPSYGRNQSESVECAVWVIIGARIIADSLVSGLAGLIGEVGGKWGSGDVQG